jgi:[acyl-carrier-protein] S-malonyltransferase
MTKLAFVFPGQGSQKVGMLGSDRKQYSSLIEEASSVLKYDLWDLIKNGPEDKLNQTEYTQPALLAVSIALFRLAQERGTPRPDVVAGHSLGEYTALVAAGVISFADGIKLVQKRGQFMQAAVPLGEGGMAAVLGLDDEQVRRICVNAAKGEVVQAANYNAPGQIVIAGSNHALDRAILECKAAGARRAMKLSVSAPFHSELMKPAAEELESVLNAVNFSAPSISVIQNVDAETHDEPTVIQNNLISQMCGAVLWTDTISLVRQMGVQNIVECGPGRVLSGLTKRIEKSMSCHSISSEEGIESVSEALCDE